MSEVLARIRVRETAGIRRFLYPLTAILDELKDFNVLRLSLTDQNGLLIPTQVSPEVNNTLRVDFAISLAPHEENELLLTEQEQKIALEDPLHIELAMDKVLFWNEQQRFSIALRHDGLHRDIIYDGVYFPKHLPSVSRNGRQMELLDYQHSQPEISTLSAWVSADGRYPDGRAAVTTTEITAVKSWEQIVHTLDDAKPGDEVVFTLPLAITSPTLTCDFGVGGYVFGKLDDKATEIVWHTEFGDAPYAKWTVATAGRVDYVGEVTTAEEFRSQRWFHLIDSDKAIAVAITILPDDCREMTVRLTRDGDMSVAFKLGESVTGHAEFGVCYHFLNDVPAIAAATNPQSILLPPVVEVLPV